MQHANFEPDDAMQATVVGVLTLRERGVCKLVVRGYSNKEISSKLSITERTVETHRANIFRKLNVHNAAELQHDYGGYFDNNLNE